MDKQIVVEVLPDVRLKYLQAESKLFLCGEQHRWALSTYDVLDRGQSHKEGRRRLLICKAELALAPKPAAQ